MYRHIKRILDFTLSIIALIILSPLFLLIGLAIKIESSGPVFFTQQRVGLNKQSFKIYKFRSMYTKAPANSPTWDLNNPDKYITKIGKIIRRRSIDELPQLINIIKGEMSIIGPRPVVWTEKKLIEKRDKYQAFLAKPGLTGLAQINGRDHLNYIEKAFLDGEYAQNVNLLNDVKIFFGTITYVLKMDGITEGVLNSVEHVNSSAPCESSEVIDE